MHATHGPLAVTSGCNANASISWVRSPDPPGGGGDSDSELPSPSEPGCLSPSREAGRVPFKIKLHTGRVPVAAGARGLIC